MNRTGRAWYTGVIVLIIIAIVGVLIAMCAPPANALDTDKHGRYIAYSTITTVQNYDAQGTPCTTYQVVRKDIRTGKIRYAAKWPRGTWMYLDPTKCMESLGGNTAGAPVGFRVVDLSPSGRYLTFYIYPYRPLGTLDYTPDTKVVMSFRKDFKTGKVKILPLRYESYFLQ